MRGNDSYNDQLIPTQKAKSQCQNACDGMSDNDKNSGGNGGGSPEVINHGRTKERPLKVNAVNWKVVSLMSVATM